MKRVCKLVTAAIFAVGLIFSFSSCSKDKDGKGGLDTTTSPITYTELSNLENVEVELPELEYFAYRLKKGDMIGVLALEYGVTEDTLISVNNIRATRYVQAGDYIKIPTIPGILYTVRKDGETIESISKKYEINSDKCSKVNSYEQTVALTAGTQLFLPDAELDWVTRQEINGDLFIKPLKCRYYISSPWGWRSNPFSGKRTFHGGIDMATSYGNLIYSALDGRVIKVGSNNVYGNYVMVQHHSGYTTLYAHMSKIRCKQGAYVQQGRSILGEVGSTGMSTGNHLHFSIYKNGKSQNPQLLWN
ncbi:MAG: M23 family metallopeptidase [Treponemataceae bacterium]|nr:M23 family metallopeptidase [Treponemataceae bacterium]